MKIREITKFDGVERDASDLLIRDAQLLEQWVKSPETAMALLSSVKAPLVLADVEIDEDGRVRIKNFFGQIQASSQFPLINWNCHEIWIFGGLTGENVYCGYRCPDPDWRLKNQYCS